MTMAHQDVLPPRPGRGVLGVALAGGRARRMGRDKTSLRLRAGEENFLERATGLLARVTDEVRVSCRADQAEGLARAGYIPLPDRAPGGKALHVVHSVLITVQRPCLIIPCDMPLLAENTLLALLECRERALAAGRRPAVTLYRREGTGYLQTLVAVYEPACLPFFERALAAGDYGLYGAVPPERRECLDYGGNEERLFYNVNTPEELEFVRRQIDGGRD